MYRFNLCKNAAFIGARMTALRLHSTLRLAAAAVTILLIAFVPDHDARTAIIFSLAFSHYLLGMWYGRRKAQLLLSHLVTAVGLLALALLGFGLFAFGFSVLAFFAIHHAANEVYLADAAAGSGEKGVAGSFRAVGVVFNAALYFMLIRSDPWLRPIDERVLLPVLIASGLLFVFLLLERTGSAREAFELSSVELLLVVLILAGVTARGVDVVFYHVFFWSLHPVAGMLRQSRRAATRFATANGVFTLLFLILSPLTPVGRAYEPHWYSLFILASFVHITLAFGLSAAHPAWMRRLFQVPVARTPGVAAAPLRLHGSS